MYNKKTLVDENMLKIYTDELIRSLKDVFAKRVETDSTIDTITPEKPGAIGIDGNGNIYVSTGVTNNDWISITDVNSATETDVDDIMRNI